MRARRSSRGWLVAAVIVVAAAVAAGFVVLGPPSQARAYRLDERRVNDLHTISLAIDRYWGRHNALPASLDALPKATGLHIDLRDPVTASPYGYRVLGDRKYELCADFERASPDDRPPFAPDDQASFLHAAGRQCFTLEARDRRR